MRIAIITAVTALIVTGGPARALVASDFYGVASMIGIATFVDQNCPSIRPNWSAVRAVAEKAGFDMDDEGQRKVIVAGASAFVDSVEKSQYAKLCATAWDKWGANGSDATDMFIRR